jgi:uncharacterized protein YdhG (YjbR/CyaY superfamily)
MATAKKATSKAEGTFTDDEKEAMKARAREAKKGKKADGLADLKAAIDELPAEDKKLAERLHRIVTEAAPDLQPKTWYGMPAWADSNGKAVCFFTPGAKFKERYASFGFNANAKLDDGNMWPTSFALLELGDAEEKKISDLVKKAIG